MLSKDYMGVTPVTAEGSNAIICFWEMKQQGEYVCLLPSSTRHTQDISFYIY